MRKLYDKQNGERRVTYIPETPEDEELLAQTKTVEELEAACSSIEKGQRNADDQD